MSGPRTPTSADGADPSSEQLSTHRFLTAPNLFTLLRLCCIPIFCWLLFGKDDQVAAAWLLGGLGATDWVDGWLARRFHQVSEFGKIFDPTADRLLFIVAIGVWDWRTRGRLHPLTLWGGLALIVSQPLRLAVMGTEGWLAFARWATGLIG